MSDHEEIISPAEIAMLAKYMDPNNDGVDADEFEDAFRTGRRLKVTADTEANGKAVLKKLVECLGTKSRE
jgi:hypothetical protein